MPDLRTGVLDSEGLRGRSSPTTREQGFGNGSISRMNYGRVVRGVVGDLRVRGRVQSKALDRRGPRVH